MCETPLRACKHCNRSRGSSVTPNGNGGNCACGTASRKNAAPTKKSFFNSSQHFYGYAHTSAGAQLTARFDGDDDDDDDDDD